MIELAEPKSLPVLSITDLEIEPGSGKLWVLDGESHNLRAFDDGAPSFSVGSIGNQPGDLFYPEEFQLLPGGGFAIFDAGNERVQVFDRGGRLQREVRPKTKAVGLAVTSTKDSLLGEPATEALVARYGADGSSMSPVGTLRNTEALASPQARLGNNRVHLQVGAADELWIAFLHELRVQKYSADGRLLLDLDLTLSLKEHGVSPDVERLPRLNTDGETLPVLIVDSSYQPIRDWLWLLLGDGAIVGLQPSGELGFVGRLQSPQPFGQIAAAPGAAVALILGEFSSGKILEINFPSTQTWLD
ncbi:MAG: hypothetical protein SF066_00020 [Thermoanaerobaculia bacterium]|nr:hypothetical protein [Thermoanaerobaculia bacterium]